MDQIRLSRIQVVKLFDTISYDIRLKAGQDIGIITAPNGKGKTTVLNLLSFLLNPTYAQFRALRDIPFSRFECELSSGKSITLLRIPKKKNRAENEPGELTLDEKPGAGTVFLRPDCDYELHVQPSDEKPVLFSELLAETENRTRTQELEELLMLAEAERRIPAGPVRQSPSADAFGVALRRYLERCGCRIPVVQIGADRLRPADAAPKGSLRGPGLFSDDPTEEACRQIGLLLRDARADYNEEVSKAKEKLPRMFLENDGSMPPVDVLQRRWKSYSEELARYRGIGLIDSPADFIRGDDIPGCYESKGDFLNTYLEAFRHTTCALKSVYDKLSLFKRIFDTRNAVTGKTVRYGRNGIELYSGKRLLSVSALSSGEKHDFIMFYHLIFNTEKDSLILIDEPEISLHIEWQESFLDYLAEICRINRLQAVIATHSPHIISTHFDCLLDKGEKNEK